MAISDWMTMQCTECPSQTFTRTVTLKWKKDGGLTPNESGYQCAQCSNVIDSQRLIARAELKLMEAELAAKKEEMRERQATVDKPAPTKPLATAKA